MDNEIKDSEIIDTESVILPKSTNEEQQITATDDGDDMQEQSAGEAHNAHRDENDAIAQGPDGKSQDAAPRVDNCEEQLRSELENERKMRIFTENKLACIEMLTAHALPIALSDYLTGESVEETRKRVEDVSKIVRTTIADEVSRRLVAMPTPSRGAHAVSGTNLGSLSLPELQRLYTVDRELYRELTKKN